MPTRRLALLGLALLAAFAAWLMAFTMTLPTTRSFPWWTLAFVASLAGLAIALARPASLRVGIAVALAGHAIMRAYFGLAGDLLTYANLLEIALCASLAAATFASARDRAWLPTAILASAGVVVLFIVRMVANGNGEAALRQVVQLVGLLALWRATA